MHRAVLALIRVDRGAPRPDEDALRKALAADRAFLRLQPQPVVDIEVAGPYAVRVGDDDFDEYVVWER
jgi:hypothetical protein